MISAIIPTYRNPDYLDLCLKSAMENKNEDDSEVIVVIDGYPEESQEVVEKYEGVHVLPLPQNMGMQYALNIGVMNASNKYVAILNDDNVFCSEWDSRLIPELREDTVLTVNQYEPHPGSIYGYKQLPLDLPPGFSMHDPKKFPYDAWLAAEADVSFKVMRRKVEYSEKGRVFPFIVTKKNYQMLGGFDTFYKSPFWCDFDFFVKAELAGLKFKCWLAMHWFHFGSIATKNRKDAEAEVFKQSEGPAAQAFNYKWGYLCNPVEAYHHPHNNTRLPIGEDEIKGIRFRS